MQYTDWLPTISKTKVDDDLIELAIQIVQNPKYHFKINNKNHTNFTLKDIIENIENRSTIDVTDMLWNILIHCSTYGKLVNCLNAFIAQVAYDGNKIYIAESNNCVMAQLLRGIMDGKMAVPTFTGTQPIEILIEMGIEKLKKDYIYICKLANIMSSKEIINLFK